jgi:Ca-activated chloride channel family protein
LLLLSLPAFSQYYLRGSIKDQKSKPVSNARIFSHSIRAYYYTGHEGSFGFIERILFDTLTINLDGYESKTIVVKTNEWQNIVLKSNTDELGKSQTRLISVIKDFQQSSGENFYTGDETYFQLVENQFIPANQYPSTGFSLNVNKASYSNVRRFLNTSSVVPPDAVRTEELVNYFNLGYKSPENDQLFKFESKISSCPWDKKNQLLYLNISAKQIKLDSVPPSNFVFLIDVSGSMDMPNRLPLLKAAFQLFVKNLRPIDTVSIVTYGGYVQIWLRPTSGANKEKILTSIESLEAGGDTPGESAIRVAYQLAKRSFIKNGNNRIILATDGDFNVGETSEKALDELITKQRESGVYLTCLGVGMGNLKDSKLQVLAKKGNGNYAYLDDIKEAERVLVKEISQNLYAVADDVSVNVKFNSSLVNQYKLIGFDNKKDALKDSANILEGGEVGSGSSVLAIFEIVPNRSLKNGDSKSQIFADFELNYKINKDTVSKRIGYSLVNNFTAFDSLSRDYKFATAITMFSLKLKQSDAYKNIRWSQIKELSNSCVDQSNYLQKEFLYLILKAQKIYRK